jgi:uncharacterized protein
MTAGRDGFLFAASVLAGAVNSVAGGGTLLSFPAAIAAGLPPIVANATNAAAMVPGSLAAAWTYRRYLAGLGRLTALLSVPAVVGALVGASILRHTPQRLFDGVVPWLVLGATLLILLQGVFTGTSTKAGSPPATTSPGPETPTAATPTTVAAARGVPVVILGAQFLVSVYGGYFGAAMGIIMLAFLGHLSTAGPQGRLDLHQMNAIKNVLAVVINGAASIDFMTHGLVRPVPAVVMAGGAIAGGIVGARLARGARPHHVRGIVVGVGFCMAALLAWRRRG